MGNDGSKRKTSPPLLIDQRDSIRAMLDIGRNEKNYILTADILQNIWRDKLSDGLLETFHDFLFRNSKTIFIEEFEMFYYSMVEASLTERAQMIVSILGIDNNIPPRSMQLYVSDLIQSYILILRQKVPDAYHSWVTGDLTQKSDIAIISQFFIRDINFIDGKLPIEGIERWLMENSFVKDLSETVVKVAFGIDVDELRPLLPKANRISCLLRIPTVLALSHFTRSNTKKWRLVYSSSEDAHSWNVFHQKISKQGPTLVLIQDHAGPLLGGYASQSWKISSNFYGDENCFLFRLRPELRICYSSGSNHNFQYMNSGATTLPNGIGMGGQMNYFGIFLSSVFGPGSVAKTCTTFKDYIPLASQIEFTFTRLEIWAIGEPDDPEDTQHFETLWAHPPITEVHKRDSVNKKPEERTGLAMDLDPTAAALLEMAGISGFSKEVS